MNVLNINDKKLSKMTDDGKRWLLAALDPYHDDQLILQGYPDQRTAPSVVQMHNQRYTLTAPAVAAGGNWDAKVSFTGFESLWGYGKPQAGNLLLNPYLFTHPYDHGTLNPGLPFASLDIMAVAPGTEFAHGSVVVGETHESLRSSLNEDIKCRLIGVAFEVHNTTAEIYKQGSVTVAMLPDCAEDQGTMKYLDTNVAPYERFDTQTHQSPTFASTVGALQAVPTSATWPAAKGLYAIPRLVKSDMPIKDLNWYWRAPFVRDSNGDFCTFEPSGYNNEQEFVPLIRGPAPSAFAPVESIWTGLSPQTTLTITFRTIVEYFPPLGSALLPSATPSASFDPYVLAVYSRVIKEAPYAVPVGMNAAGDYFRAILRTIGKALPAVAPFLGPVGPLATAVGPYLVKWGTKAEKPPPLPPRPATRAGERAVTRNQAGASAIPFRK